MCLKCYRYSKNIGYSKINHHSPLESPIRDWVLLKACPLIMMNTWQIYHYEAEYCTLFIVGSADNCIGAEFQGWVSWRKSGGWNFGCIERRRYFFPIYILCILYIFSILKYNNYIWIEYIWFIMNNTAVRTRRKNIDIREDVYRFLSIRAAASGTNLKNYIESLLEKEAKPMTRNTRRNWGRMTNNTLFNWKWLRLT